MTRTVTKTAVKKIITKGLTGWERGKLILQDSVDSYFRRESVLTDSDIATIRNAPMEGADVRDYNMFMALGRGFDMGHILGEWTCADACLQISFLERMLRDANKRRTVELFESFGPHVVTRRQYEDIVAAQRQKKLEFEFILGYVIEERFYATAPPRAREEIDDLCLDIESAEDFASAVPEKHSGIFHQAVEDVRRLHTSGKLPVAFRKGDAKETEPLLEKWKTGRLPVGDATKLMDMLYVNGQQLYDCDGLPEWQAFVDEYQRHWFDDDERFRHAYAILDDCPQTWMTENGYYKQPEKPSTWITQGTELHLGLIAHDGKPKNSVQSVAAELKGRLETALLDVRLLLTDKAVLDAAAEAVGLDIPGKGGTVPRPYMRLGAFIALYNIRLEELNDECKSRDSDEVRLEKALKMLPPIDPKKLRPSADSLKQLKDNVLKDAHAYDWLRTTILSLEYEDGFSFRELMQED